MFAAGSQEAQGSKEVVIYTSNQTGLVDLVVEEFEKLYPEIEVLVVRGGGGELLGRIAAEADRPQGDVMWGGGKESLESYAQYFTPYLPEAVKHMNSEYYHPEGLWIGNMIHLHVIMANEKLLGNEKPPTTWAGTLDPKWSDRIVYANPSASGSAYTQLALLVQVFGEKQAAMWKKTKEFLENVLIVGGSGLVYRGVGDGEYPLGVTMEYAAYSYVVGGAPIKIIYPEEGTVAQPEGSAIIKNAPNMENAKLFQEVVNSKPVRERILKEFYRRPARDDINVSEVAPGLADIAEIKLAEFDTQWAAEKQSWILQTADQVIMNR
jgi:iron(III) transport system substrate-binding protein